MRAASDWCGITQNNGRAADNGESNFLKGQQPDAQKHHQNSEAAAAAGAEAVKFSALSPAVQPDAEKTKHCQRQAERPRTQQFDATV